ncbi:MAG: hypothetical protein KC415_05705, partial [Anaerolineales bacterium]|nr:hypothetical protein [Anaerolineales bacterium]
PKIMWLSPIMRFVLPLVLVASQILFNRKEREERKGNTRERPLRSLRPLRFNKFFNRYMSFVTCAPSCFWRQCN